MTEPKIVVACHFVRLSSETKATSPQTGGIAQKSKSDAVFTKLSRKRRVKLKLKTFATLLLFLSRCRHLAASYCISTAREFRVGLATIQSNGKLRVH